jgi:dipeptidyl aminopeptidase/acylaminoacyl peptidase
MALAAWLLALPTAVFGQSQHTPTIDESLSLKTLDSPRISPDGKYVAYSVRETDWKQNAYVSHLWLAEVETGRTLQLTRGKKSSENAQWSPDGRWLAFVTERESDASSAPPAPAPEEKDEKKPGAIQIWLISPRGGEAWELTEHETDVGEFRWSKDGKKIAFTAPPAETKANKDRKEKYSDFEVSERDYSQNQLWLVDVAAAEAVLAPLKAKQVTSDPALNVTGFAWSPDSTQLAFSATPNPLMANRGDSDIYLLDLGHENRVRRIVALPGPDNSPVFSPDGKRLAFTTALGQKYYYYVNGHIATVDLDTVLAHPATDPSEVKDLTAHFDEDADLLDWGPDGIFFDALQKTTSHLFRLDPDSGAITRLTQPAAFVLEGISFTKDFKTVALASSDSRHMTELFISGISPFAPRQLTDMNGQLKDLKLGTAELVSWKSPEGTTIEGVLHKPADYDPSRKYPLLVLIHGGPTGIAMPLMDPAEHYYPVQIFLSKGALVLEPNYRGSAGYGEAFRALNVRNLGVGDMADVMSGADALIARGLADPERLGAMGWSQGGYISAFLTTHTDRFKAISAGAGISDWMTYYVSTDVTPFTRMYLHATPWDDPAIYARTSPITTIKSAKTPTLIQTGNQDKRVPPPDSFELYRGLQDQHVPSRLLLYAGFGHPITKPKSNRAVMKSNLDWFSHYLWGEPIPKESPLLGASEVETGK